ARAAIRRTAGKFLVAAKFPVGPIAAGKVAIPRRPRAVGAIPLRPVLAKTFTAWRVGSLLATTITRGIRLFVTELLVGETRGRAGIAARGIRALFTAVIISRAKILPRSAIRPIALGTAIPVEARRTPSVFIEAARSIVVITAGRRAFAFAGVRFARAGIGLLAIRFGTIGFAGVRALVAVALAGQVLAGKTTFGEFLLGPAGCAGAALAAGRPITPAARGIVVFIVIAGHVWSHFGCRGIGNQADVD